MATLEQDVVGRREGQAGSIVGDELLETWLVDGHLTPLQPGDLGLVDVHAHDVVPEVGEAHGRDEADVPGPDDPDRSGIHVEQNLRGR